MGLSINLITLFAMVLAIGVVVDDAIVVVEAVHAKMAEKHLSPYRATMEVLHEISGAIIAITLVMTVRLRSGDVHPRAGRRSSTASSASRWPRPSSSPAWWP